MEEPSPDYGSVNFELEPYESLPLPSPPLKASGCHQYQAYVENVNLTFPDFDIDDNRPPSPTSDENGTNTSDRHTPNARQEDIPMPDAPSATVSHSFTIASVSKPSVQPSQLIMTQSENARLHTAFPNEVGHSSSEGKEPFYSPLIPAGLSIVLQVFSRVGYHLFSSECAHLLCRERL